VNTLSVVLSRSRVVATYIGKVLAPGKGVTEANASGPGRLAQPGIATARRAMTAQRVPRRLLGVTRTESPYATDAAQYDINYK
jgi:hypothetical protein